MRWLFFPPVVSFFLLIVSALLHNRASAVRVPELIWGMTVASYIFMCAVSLFYIMKRDDRFNFGISILTQGLLLSVMSLRFGAKAMSLLGLVMFMTGLVTVFFYSTRSNGGDMPVGRAVSDDSGGALKRVDSVLEKLAIPVCYTDNRGVIAWATARFCEAAGRSPGDVIGEFITEIISIDGEQVVLESGQWWLTQT
jgi:PAS domain-containing protein